MIHAIKPLHRTQRVTWQRELLKAYTRIASDPKAPLHERDAVNRLIPRLRKRIESEQK